MRIFALLSWYDEQPEHLRRCVESLKGFADALVAVDGPYATFPGHAAHEAIQRWTVGDAARTSGLRPILVNGRTWHSEVSKRAFMFAAARAAGATPEDWLLVIDADEAIAYRSTEARVRLAGATCDVARVQYQGVQIDGKVHHVSAERRLYRALPGLTVEQAHWLYTVPTPTRRFLWRTPDGHMSPERELDLGGYLTMNHYNSARDPERRQRALDYYKDRHARGLEAIGDL